MMRQNATRREQTFRPEALTQHHNFKADRVIRTIPIWQNFALYWQSTL